MACVATRCFSERARRRRRRIPEASGRGRELLEMHIDRLRPWRSQFIEQASAHDGQARAAGAVQRLKRAMRFKVMPISTSIRLMPTVIAMILRTRFIK